MKVQSSVLYLESSFLYNEFVTHSLGHSIENGDEIAAKAKAKGYMNRCFAANFLQGHEICHMPTDIKGAIKHGSDHYQS